MDHARGGPPQPYVEDMPPSWHPSALAGTLVKTLLETSAGGSPVEWPPYWVPQFEGAPTGTGRPHPAGGGGAGSSGPSTAPAPPGRASSAGPAPRLPPPAPPPPPPRPAGPGPPAAPAPRPCGGHDARRMGPHGPGARPWSAAVGWAQPRSRREALLLASLVLITLFFSARLWQLHPRGPAAALAGHTVLRRFFVQEPTVVTEVIINRRPVRPQPGAGAGSKDAGRLESRIHAAIRPLAREPEAAARPAAILQDGVHRVARPASAGAPPLPGIPLESTDAQWPVARPAKDTDALFRASLAKRKQPQRLRGAPVKGAAEGPKQRLPQEFDWQTYLLYQPELRYSGITTEELAKRHYLDFGRAEGRIYKRLARAPALHRLHGPHQPTLQPQSRPSRWLRCLGLRWSCRRP